MKKKTKKVKAWAIKQGRKRTSPPTIEFTAQKKIAKYFESIDYKVIPVTITYEI